MRTAVVPGILVAAILLMLETTTHATATTFPATTSDPDTGIWCTPTDEDLAELSGLYWSGDTGYAVGDHGSDDRLALLDHRCEVSRWVHLATETIDVEDLTRASTGTLWLADTGDNDLDRTTVSLIGLDPVTAEHSTLPMSYLDGPHDVEAFTLSPVGQPVLVTKTDDGPATVYTTADNATVTTMPTDTPTTLIAVGTVPATAADGSIRSITGAAVSADKSLAALRTKKDVFVYHVHDGDIAETFTDLPDLVLQAPQQPQGEALAFTDDNALLLASEADGGPLPSIRILSEIPDRMHAAQSDDTDLPLWTPLIVTGLLATGGVAWWVRRRS
ncbi:hypothetical protein [Nocardia grenadensis]|uniref:hypothetical protein n=1 Tax=Nocardia grenadensis TaxID=931537 RepID=UPI003D8DE498